MVKFIDLLLYSEENVTDIEQLVMLHSSNLGYLQYLSNQISATVIQHAGFTQKTILNKVDFQIYMAKNSRWRIPIRLFISIKKQSPAVILVHSMIYAWQIIF